MSSKLKSRAPWREKLERQDHSKVVEIPPKMATRFGHGTMLIPKPLDVDTLMRKAKKGQLVTVSQIRVKLANDNGVDVTCPLTTGIFVRIAAEAAAEDLQKGKKLVTPYWRLIRDDGSLHEKMPGGVQEQSRRLTAEGHTLEPATGKRPPRVKDFEKHLVRL